MHSKARVVRELHQRKHNHHFDGSLAWIVPGRQAAWCLRNPGYPAGLAGGSQDGHCTIYS